MPVTLDTNTNQRIRTGLKFLAKADVAAIHAAVVIEKLEGVPHPSGVADLLKKFTFNVEGIRYKGRMTQPQCDYLSAKTATLETFVAAIDELIIYSNTTFLDVLGDLNRALGAPTAAARLNGGPDPIIVPPALGCCTYDDNEQTSNMTQSFCQGGLQGTWTPGPCGGTPLSNGGNGSKPALRRSK